MGDREPGRVQSVCKAMDLLSCLAEARTPLTLGELSRRTGMPKATVHGLLSALRSSAVVEQSDEDGRYRLGIRLFEYGCAVSRGWNVLEAAAEIGIPQSAADLSQGNRLVADYSAAWVREAIRRAGTGSASTRCWRYVEAILRRWRERGGMDEAHQDARAPAGEEDSARLREDARTLARLRGELPR